VWRLVTLNEGEESRLDLKPIQKEACQVIANGLMIMYPTNERRVELMRQLLREGLQDSVYLL